MMASDCAIRACAVHEERNESLRIERQIVALAVLAAAASQVPRQRLVLKALEIKRDAHPIGGGTAKVGIELHRQ